MSLSSGSCPLDTLRIALLTTYVNTFFKLFSKNFSQNLATLAISSLEPKKDFSLAKPPRHSATLAAVQRRKQGSQAALFLFSPPGFTPLLYRFRRCSTLRASTAPTSTTSGASAAVAPPPSSGTSSHSTGPAASFTSICIHRPGKPGPLPAPTFTHALPPRRRRPHGTAKVRFSLFRLRRFFMP